MNTVLTLSNGRQFDFADKATWRSLDVDTAMDALQRIHRFNGHRVGALSVLAHSSMVGQMMQMVTLSPLACLCAYLHDVEEAVTGDIPSPFKKMPCMGPSNAWVESELRPELALNFMLSRARPGRRVPGEVLRAARVKLYDAMSTPALHMADRRALELEVAGVSSRQARGLEVHIREVLSRGSPLWDDAAVELGLTTTTPRFYGGVPVRPGPGRQYDWFEEFPHH